MVQNNTTECHEAQLFQYVIKYFSVILLLGKSPVILQEAPKAMFLSSRSAEAHGHRQVVMHEIRWPIQAKCFTFFNRHKEPQRNGQQGNGDFVTAPLSVFRKKSTMFSGL
jgi:hypothetical protein